MDIFLKILPQVIFAKSVMGNIIFHAGSQLTYLKEDLRKHLNLETIQTENVIVNTFGILHESKPETLDVVPLKITHRYERKYIFVGALYYLYIQLFANLYEIKKFNFLEVNLLIFLRSSWQILMKVPIGMKILISC